MEGAKKSGFGGFLSGTLKGLSGLVVKPVSGTLDFMSKTAEGIKHTPDAIFNRDKLKKDERVRLPRPFYTRQEIFKQFEEIHAFINIRLLML